MNDRAGTNGTVPEGGVHDAARYYKKKFWSEENLKFSQPWYRLEKSAKIISKLAGGRQCTLLDIGCGPAALMRVLPPNIQYYGIDIAIQMAAPNLIEADILEAPIKFDGKQFDLVIAHGLFEYVGEFQSQKLSEVAQILKKDGKFLLTYTNFGHRKKYVYPAFSNVQPLDDFRRDLERYFKVDRVFPVAHNWKHGHPGRKLIKAANMHVNANIPFIGPVLAVEYYFICSPQS